MNRNLRFLSDSLLSVIDDLESLLRELLGMCTELYNQSSDLKKNSDSIARIGVELQKKEDFLSGHTSQYFDIVVKYIEMARNNIDERDFQKLAAQNVSMYRDASGLVANLKENIHLVSLLLKEIQ